MNANQTSAYVMSQSACALIEAMGMQAENMQRQSLGHSMAYDDAAFSALIDKYGIHHNAATIALQNCQEQ